MGGNLSTRVIATRPTADPRNNYSFVSSFIYSFIGESLSVSSVLGMVLGPGDAGVSYMERFAFTTFT